MKITGVKPVTFKNKDGELINLVEITLENGTVNRVEKDSIYDPTSRMYNAILDGNTQ